MSPVRRVLAASLILLAMVVAWFLTQSGSTPALPGVTSTPSPPAPALASESGEQQRDPIAAPSPQPALPKRVASIGIPPPTSTRQTAVEDSVPVLEQRIRSAKDPEERVEFITNLAQMDSAAAILAMERLFTIERHPKVQVALIASLVDMDAAVQPDARMRILRAAAINQPRDVRTTALEVLAESEDPAARELLHQCSVSDPDHEVREVAAALYGANSR